MNYYNEIDPTAAAWLRELIKSGEIPDGRVDVRSITDVHPADLAGFTQCHFFAGIGGWSYALKLAGWPEDEPVWTGSCPCQPFSASGKQLGRADSRHLWPSLRRLINRARPAIVFGEQVASALGRDWLAGVCANLETMGYAVGAADLCAAGVGAPHIRQRLYWVADSAMPRLQESGSTTRTDSERPDSNSQRGFSLGQSPDGGWLGDAGCERDESRGGFGDVGRAPSKEQGETQQRKRRGYATSSSGANSRLEHTPGDGREQRRSGSGGRGIAGGCESRGLGDTNEQGRSRQSLGLLGASHQGHWSNSELIPCRDGKSRRIESGTFPLAHGIPGRVGLLRGYGNAIVPQVAAEFIKAYLEC